MLSQSIYYGLLIALAIGLLWAAYTDLKRREIDNWLNLAIACTAPLSWLVAGGDLWPGVAIQLGFAVVVTAILLGMYALRLMGGGDMKLLAALSLWLSPVSYLQMLIIMAIVGGGLALFYLARKIIRKSQKTPKLPYGVAIAAGGLWVLFEPLSALSLTR